MGLAVTKCTLGVFRAAAGLSVLILPQALLKSCALRCYILKRVARKTQPWFLQYRSRTTDAPALSQFAAYMPTVSHTPVLLTRPLHDYGTPHPVLVVYWEYKRALKLSLSSLLVTITDGRPRNMCPLNLFLLKRPFHEVNVRGGTAIVTCMEKVTGKQHRTIPKGFRV